MQSPEEPAIGNLLGFGIINNDSSSQFLLASTKELPTSFDHSYFAPIDDSFPKLKSVDAVPPLRPIPSDVASTITHPTLEYFPFRSYFDSTSSSCSIPSTVYTLPTDTPVSGGDELGYGSFKPVESKGIENSYASMEKDEVKEENSCASMEKDEVKDNLSNTRVSMEKDKVKDDLSNTPDSEKVSKSDGESTTSEILLPWKHNLLTKNDDEYHPTTDSNTYSDSASVFEEK